MTIKIELLEIDFLTEIWSTLAHHVYYQSEWLNFKEDQIGICLDLVFPNQVDWGFCLENSNGLWVGLGFYNIQMGGTDIEESLART